MRRLEFEVENAMPMVRLARTAGQGAILGAKNKLDSLRAEDPIAYDTAVLRERNFSETAKRVNPAMRAKANEQMQELATKDYQKPEGMLLKKGGLTASRRGDGIASRGKTKGRFV
jgi:hypothetical protein